MINLKQIFFLLSFVCCTVWVQAQSPKQEWRSVWFQTVWAGDWPKKTGQTNQVKEFDTHLARFEKLGINTICFQVRNMCDAVYRSEIEPWSQWVTGTRGGDPGYDPLEVLIEKAHAKGMEVHVWINPYRYASAGTYANCKGDNEYVKTHPEWIKYCDGAEIYVINPSDPSVRAQIVKVIQDIITRYDVDGVVFDDYFYQNGYKDSYDDEFYKANNPNGLSRADWRRHQVNLMVRDVHDAIKAYAPWCRFGIGPAGVAASDKDVAAKYGVTPCPGSDWQYSGIYSEPIQWFVDHTIDYMSPQVYWPIGWAAGDYQLITPWWYYAAHHFNRHCYISQSLSGLQATNKTKPMATAVQSSFDAFEIVRQIDLNYSSCLDNAPGMQFFNATGFSKTAFVPVLTENIWTNKAKVPAMTWYNVPKQGLVDNVSVSGTTVSWTSSIQNVRYGVYAIPKANRQDADIISSSKYYLGMSYGNSFTIADTLTTAKYDFAVTVIDRYGHEWTPRFYGEPKVSTKPSVTLTTPAEGGALLTPGKLCWAPVTNATHYSVQVASDKAMNNILVQYQTGEPMLRTRMFECLNNEGTYYWRVMPHVPNAESDWSSVRSCTTRPFSVLNPKANDTTSVTPLIEWDDAGAGETYLVEISSKENSFAQANIAWSATTMATSITVPEYILWYQREYYLRVSTVGEESLVTAVVPFITGKIKFEIPQITSPQDGSTLEYPTIHVTCNQVLGNGYKFEISNRSDFPTRGGLTKRKITDMGVNYCDVENMADGVYYAHVAARTSQAVYTAFGATIQFTYTKTTGITDVKVMDNQLPRKVITPRGMMILRRGKLYDLQGKVIK